MGSSVLVIDNYDSFTYNLVQMLGGLGASPVVVHRHDAIDLQGIRELDPDGIVISPGPGRPEDAGISCGVIAEFGPSRPVLGVCLGHQCIATVFGGEVIRAPQLMHGKTSWVRHSGVGVLAGLGDPFEATRYHSLIVDRPSLPAALEVTAETDGGIIMAMRHRAHPIEGVQFHPESILTVEGRQLLENFLGQVTAWKSRSCSSPTPG